MWLFCLRNMVKVPGNEARKVRTWFCPRDMVKIYSINMPENMPRFCLRSMVNIRPFSPVFPLAEPVAKAFCRLFLWNSKEKSVSHFLWHSHWKKADE